MTDATRPTAALTSFESFLIEKGKVDLKEFYNRLFQLFFADCHWSGFEQSEQTAVIGRNWADGSSFGMSLHLSAPEIGLYPTTEDRDFFHQILNDITEDYPSAALWDNFEFQMNAEKIEQISSWLERLISINGKVKAEYICCKGENHFRVISGLRIVNDYQITRTSNKNTLLVVIEFAAWIRRGYNEHLLDLGVMSLLSSLRRLESNGIIPLVNTSTVSSDQPL